jgi:hypothetical protein
MLLVPWFGSSGTSLLLLAECSLGSYSTTRTAFVALGSQEMTASYTSFGSIGKMDTANTWHLLEGVLVQLTDLIPTRVGIGAYCAFPWG